MTSTMARDQRTGREVLPGARLDVLRVLLQQPFICVPFYVRAHHRPIFLVDQIYDQAAATSRGPETCSGTY